MFAQIARANLKNRAEGRRRIGRTIIVSGHVIFMSGRADWERLSVRCKAKEPEKYCSPVWEFLVLNSIIRSMERGTRMAAVILRGEER
jgi:hypothetical protein